jgi:uncharacterized protein
VLLGTQHIIAEIMAETAGVRGVVRVVRGTRRQSLRPSTSGSRKDRGRVQDYFQFREARTIPPHRILAINRGEKDNNLAVRLEFDLARVQRAAADQLPLADHPHREFLFKVLDDALARLVLPSLEREIRRELTRVAEDHAVMVFARNLRSLLLQPPLRGKPRAGDRPGVPHRLQGCLPGRVWQPLADAVIFPHLPQNRRAEAKAKMEELIRQYGSQVIAIGNGTACRETEELVSDVIAPGQPHRAPPRPKLRPRRYLLLRGTRGRCAATGGAHGRCNGVHGTRSAFRRRTAACSRGDGAATRAGRGPRLRNR